MNAIQKVTQKIPVFEAIQWNGTEEDATFFAATIPNFWYGTVPPISVPEEASEEDATPVVADALPEGYEEEDHDEEEPSHAHPEDVPPVGQEPTNDPEPVEEPTEEPSVPLLGLVRNPWEAQDTQLNVGDWVLIFPEGVVAKSEQDFNSEYDVKPTEN